MRRVALFTVPLALALHAAAVQAQSAEPAPPAPATAPDAPTLPAVTVRERRPLDMGPMPGLPLTREQIPANVQSADKNALKKSGALTIGEFMNAQLPSVSINDYSGNPYQFDLNYRGFTASPQIGTPQGLSVFFDGIRVNEPFGDIVNWDLLPMNAIERFDLFPGSNPLFGLNTLGGALSLRSKSGFSAPGFDGEMRFGSFGRREVQLAGGVNDGTLAGFVALTHFDERGWRDNSPSTVQQVFARGDVRGGWGTAGVSVLAAGNDLIGNGLIPVELWQQRAQSVFTSPDQTKNRLVQGSLFGTLDVSDTFSITGQVYRRNSQRRGVNGDIYEDFADFDPEVDRVRGAPRPRTSPLPMCQYLDANRDGRRDTEITVDGSGAGIENELPPLNDPNNEGLCDIRAVVRPGGAPRNGAGESGTATGSGVVAGTPIGLISKTAIDQLTDGAALQFNWNLERHQLMLGASIDASAAEYRMAQRLGLIDATHQVYEAPGLIDPLYRAAQVDIQANDFDGTSRTRSLYLHETWTPREGLHLSLAARYNRTRTHTRLLTRSGIGSEAGALHNLRNRNLNTMFVLCPTADPASCPSEPQPAPLDVSALPSTPTEESFDYRSFNPSLGVSWLPTSALNLFANWSRGARTPSVVELGCAFDATPVNLFAGRTDDVTGEPVTPVYRARSLVGPTCTLPSTLSGDPFLPQIRATSAEVGARVQLDADWSWNVSFYRTDLKDDIYFVGVGAERSFFDTIGKTRREGLELGLKGRLAALGGAELSLNYGYTDATFQSRFFVLSPHNSSADFDQNSQPGSAVPTPTANDNKGLGTYQMIRVDPGARMPGIARHSLNVNLSVPVTPAWKLTLGMVAHSGSFMRGNENNAHRAGGTDGETGLYTGGTSPGCDANGYCGGVSGAASSAGRPFTLGGRVPGFAVFNLASSFELQRGMSLLAQIGNLFDRKYFTAGRLGVNPFSAGTHGAIGESGWNYNSGEWRNTSFVGPGSPRSIWLGINIEFDAD